MKMDFLYSRYQMKLKKQYSVCFRGIMVQRSWLKTVNSKLNKIDQSCFIDKMNGGFKK